MNFILQYLRGGSGDCVFGYVYLMELSTPFVSFRGILSILDLKHTTTYIVNGLLMLVLFFICRVLIGPYVLYIYSDIVNLTYLQVNRHKLFQNCDESIIIPFSTDTFKSFTDMYHYISVPLSSTILLVLFNGFRST